MREPYLESAQDDTGGFVGLAFATAGTVRLPDGRAVAVRFPADADQAARLAIIADAGQAPVALVAEQPDPATEQPESASTIDAAGTAPAAEPSAP